MMRSGRVLLLLALAALLAIGPAAWSQQIPRATCLDCHEEEGMRYAVLQATPFISIPTGETQDLEITVGNPWLHDITSARVTVDLTNATPLTFDTPDPIHERTNVTLSPGDAPANLTFAVQAGATAIIAKATQPPDQTSLGTTDADTTLYTPGGQAIDQPREDGINPAEPGAPRPVQETEAYVIDDDRTAETGDWALEVDLASGPPDTEISISIDVFYNASRTQPRLLTQTIDPSGSESLAFPIKATEQGPVQIDYEVVVTSFYEHPGGIGAQDEGNETLTGSLEFTIGEELELGEAGPALPPTPPINWKMNARIWGEATGFIGLFMVPLSLVLGGAFGRRNVLWMNKVTRSARLRVLWHNALSFALLAISLIHLVLFLYEPVYDWSVGFVWGGLGTLALVGLGITGGFQRRFARSMGYANWRLLHIAMAVGFVASVLAHVLIDGAHFDFLREWLRLV